MSFIGKRAIARYASGPGSHIEGEVIAYCEAPQVLIRSESGRRQWWRVDLTEFHDHGDDEQEVPC